MEIETVSQQKPTPADVLSVQEFADRTAVNWRTVYRRVHDGTIRSFRLGRAIRIPRSELDRLLQGT